MGLVGVVSIVVAVAGFAVAQAQSPDATPSLTEGSVAVGIGFNWGNGTLTYRGETYPVKVEGLSVGDVGVTRASAMGIVFNLTNVSDISGIYRAIGAGISVGKGAGVMTMENQKGVVIKLSSTTEGLNFKAAAEGVRLTLAN
jgi:hypothetical protein